MDSIKFPPLPTHRAATEATSDVGDNLVALQPIRHTRAPPLTWQNTDPHPSLDRERLPRRPRPHAYNCHDPSSRAPVPPTPTATAPCSTVDSVDYSTIGVGGVQLQRGTVNSPRAGLPVPTTADGGTTHNVLNKPRRRPTGQHTRQRVKDRGSCTASHGRRLVVGGRTRPVAGSAPPLTSHGHAAWWRGRARVQHTYTRRRPRPACQQTAGRGAEGGAAPRYEEARCWQ